MDDIADLKYELESALEKILEIKGLRDSNRASALSLRVDFYVSNLDFLDTLKGLIGALDDVGSWREAIGSEKLFEDAKALCQLLDSAMKKYEVNDIVGYVNLIIESPPKIEGIDSALSSLPGLVILLQNYKSDAELKTALRGLMNSMVLIGRAVDTTCTNQEERNTVLHRTRMILGPALELSRRLG